MPSRYRPPKGNVVDDTIGIGPHRGRPLTRKEKKDSDKNSEEEEKTVKTKGMKKNPSSSSASASASASASSSLLEQLQAKITKEFVIADDILEEINKDEVQELDETIKKKNTKTRELQEGARLRASLCIKPFTGMPSGYWCSGLRI